MAWLIENAQFSAFLKICGFNTHSCDLQVWCYGKDCESEVRVNLDFRIRPINCIHCACLQWFQEWQSYWWTSKQEFGRISRHIGTFNCLSVHIFSSGRIKICSKKIRKLSRLFCLQLCQITGNLLLTLCQLWCLIWLSKAIDNIFKDFNFQSQNQKKDIKLLYLKVGKWLWIILTYTPAK